MTLLRFTGYDYKHPTHYICKTVNCCFEVTGLALNAYEISFLTSFVLTIKFQNM